MRIDFGGGQDILFERRGRAGFVTLNRASALNALTHDMVLALFRALTAWQDDAQITQVVVAAEGRAFCAGGDILDIYHAGMSGKADPAFFADEYRLNALIARYPKPYVALIDGIVMGGGVGISVHGSHRVMSENTVFAMPEVSIGFFPDVGGSYFLPRLGGSFGVYLALTGERIGWGDALRAGIATHALDSERFDNLAQSLAETSEIESVFAAIDAVPAPKLDERSVTAIDNCFSANDLDTVIARLNEAAESGDEFLAGTMKTIALRSPTSTAVAFRQMENGASMSMDECMRMEYRILNRMLAGHDFYEGIRAAIVDRSRPPIWDPADLSNVTTEMVDAYFAPLGQGELQLP